MRNKHDERSVKKARIRAWSFFVMMLAWFFVVSSGMAQMDPRAEWNRTLKAAEAEGKFALVHGGGASSAMQRLFKEGFSKQFPKIKVEFIVAGGRSIAPRVLSERRAGRFGWDVYIGGTTTALRLLMPAGAFDPVAPALILPEVTDPKKWFGGKIDYAVENTT